MASPVLPNALPDEQDATAEREKALMTGVGKVNEDMTRGVSQQSQVGELPTYKAKRPKGVLPSIPQNNSYGTATADTAALAARQVHVRSTVTSLLQRKSQKRESALAHVDGLDKVELGIAFHLRAAQDAGKDTDAPASGNSHDAGGITRSHPLELPKSVMRKLFRALRTSTQMGRVLKFSALFSWAFVLGSFSMESACMGDRYPDFAGRLRDESLLKENLVLCVHLANGVCYTVLALLCHVLSHRPGNLFEITRSTLGSRKYVTLVCDLVTIPGLIAEFVHLSEKPAVVPTAAQWITLLQVAKVWRIVLPGQIVSASTDTFVKGVIGLFSSLALFVHVLAVLLVFLANLEHSWGGNSWVRTHFAEERSCFVLYSEVLYFTALSVTSVGYGDLLTTPLERGLNTFLLLLSQLFTAKVCADLTWLTSLYNHWEAEQQAQQAQTSVALLHLQVPKTLSERVLAFQSFLSNVHRDESLDQPAFRGLSPNLSQELRLCAYRRLVLQAPFLREQPMKVIARIVSSLEDAIFLPADFIVRCGDTGRELFFMRRGEAGVFATRDEPPIWGQSVEVRRYIAGDYFGELSMLTSKPRSAWIMAKTYLVVSKLQHHVVESIKDEFPEAFTALVQSMVSGFSLKATTEWPDIAAAWRRKVGPGDAEDCYLWFCQQAAVDVNYSSNADDEEIVEELSAKAFEIGLKLLHVKEIDRMVLWADLDSDNSGFVSFEEFFSKMCSDEEWGGSDPPSPTSQPVRSFAVDSKPGSPSSPSAKRRSIDSSQEHSLPRPSPRSSIFSGHNKVPSQVETEIQNLSEKVALMYNDMQSMTKLLQSLAASEQPRSDPL
eukprot:TRINITY_DN88678_c0_g1_i1.p1 TRINITY_DN88678_c0_g1~~TRINITY_DN88678_c0_g1_i1.p1  ORF type:complete len:834 (+),score=128.19 TRINITY_DN88678_c0_g1_i1:71-2572(+)